MPHPWPGQPFVSLEMPHGGDLQPVKCPSNAQGGGGGNEWAWNWQSQSFEVHESSSYLRYTYIDSGFSLYVKSNLYLVWFYITAHSEWVIKLAPVH